MNNTISNNGLSMLDYISTLKFIPPEECLFILKDAYIALDRLPRDFHRLSTTSFYKRIVHNIYEPFSKAVLLKNKETSDESCTRVMQAFYREHKFSYYLQNFFKDTNKDKDQTKIVDRYRKNLSNYKNLFEYFVTDYEKMEQDELQKIYSNISNYLHFFGEIYFLVDYCIEYGDLLGELSNKEKEKFTQAFLSIGEKFKENTENCAPQNNSPTNSKFNIITKYDVLDKVQLSVPFSMADCIELEDIENIVEQKYFISQNPIQTLTFINEDELYEGFVFIRCLNDRYLVWQTSEQYGLAPIIEVIEIVGIAQFNQFFTDFINRFDLLREHEVDVNEELEDLSVSTIEEIIVVLTLLTT